MTALNVDFVIVDSEGKPTLYFEDVWRSLDAVVESGIADQVETNTENISTNTENISTNTENISNNTEAIAAIDTSGINVSLGQILTGEYWDGSIVSTTGEWTLNSLALTVDLAIVDGGTGASDAVTALSNLGGQPLDAGLTSISGLVTSADKMIYTTASDVYATTDLTVFARTLLDDTTAAAMRTTLGLVIGTDVQAWSSNLDSINQDLGTTDDHTMNKLIATDTTDTTSATSNSSIKGAGGLSMAKGGWFGGNLVADDIMRVGGVVTQAWAAGFGTFQAGSSGLFGSDTTDNTSITNNMVFDGTNWRYILTDDASRLQQRSSQLIFQTAGAGTAGNIVTFTTRLTADATTTAGNTSLLLWDVDNATLERVTVGAADSGGVGFKVLRIPN